MPKPVNTPRTNRQVSAPPVWRPVIAEVAAKHRLPPREMLSGWMTPKCVAARHELFFRLSNRGISAAEIGRRLGGYDHTTVLHGLRKFRSGVGEQAA